MTSGVDNIKSEDEIWAVYNRFARRLDRLGIAVECSCNYPWVYLDTVNGKEVIEYYMSNHAFTAFWAPINQGDGVRFTDRRKVFNKIREML